MRWSDKGGNVIYSRMSPYCSTVRPEGHYGVDRNFGKRWPKECVNGHQWQATAYNQLCPECRGKGRVVSAFMPGETTKTKGVTE